MKRPTSPSRRLPHRTAAAVTTALATTLCTALGTALVPAGCTTAPRPVPPPPTQAVDIAPGRYADAFAAAVETLRRSGFRIDRADHRFGVVTTRPEGSPTLFEPWKAGNTTHHTRVLSTLNDVRRTVTVTFDAEPAAAHPLVPAAPPREKSDARRMSVAVHLETRDAPGRRLDGRTDGRVFTDPTPPRAVDENEDVPAAWKAIGRDPGLEAQLQRRILARLDTH